MHYGLSILVGKSKLPYCCLPALAYLSLVNSTQRMANRRVLIGQRLTRARQDPAEAIRDFFLGSLNIFQRIAIAEELRDPDNLDNIERRLEDVQQGLGLLRLSAGEEARNITDNLLKIIPEIRRLMRAYLVTTGPVQGLQMFKKGRKLVLSLMEIKSL